MRSLFVVAVIALFTSLSLAATIYVPRDYPTIQGAIDAAIAGDTIIVSPGTYVENITLPGKAIHLKSEAGPYQTVIDGNQVDRVVNIKSVNTSDTILEGMTITNGNYRVGGGISCGASSVIITNCIVKNNTSRDEGGGIYIGGGYPTVSYCTIINNSTDFEGAGISIHCSLPTIIGNTIMGNTAGTGYKGQGGGIATHDSTISLINNNIIGNEATYYGGGICFERFVDAVFVGNTVAYNDTILGSGGGVFCGDENTLTATNNIIVGNSAPNAGGGGIACQGYSPILNTTNTILWGNNAATGKELVVRGSSLPPIVTIRHSDVDGGLSSCFVETGCTFSWGPGMIDADPLFADPTNNDFHLTWDSPCRNTGDNTAVTEPYDFEGDPRIAQGTVDMGADEFYCHLYNVGNVLPGSPIDIKVVGDPSLPAILALGTGIQDPPQTTPHGDLWLMLPLAKSWQLGLIPSTGILTHTATVPSGWLPGSQHPFQALVGPWGGPSTRLTNLMQLTVE